MATDRLRSAGRTYRNRKRRGVQTGLPVPYILEPYRAFSSRIASPLGICEREPNRIGVPMLEMLSLNSIRIKVFIDEVA
jgi:hypothetical protein